MSLKFSIKGVKMYNEDETVSRENVRLNLFWAVYVIVVPSTDSV